MVRSDSVASFYGEAPEAEKRYSPAQCIGAKKNTVESNPDPNHIGTSYAEQLNLSMRKGRPHGRRHPRGLLRSVRRQGGCFIPEHAGLKRLSPLMISRIDEHLSGIVAVVASEPMRNGRMSGDF
jgi:hypothetical protein